MVSAGEKPAVISALLKYVSTERMRGSVNDALDIHGGRGICDGPSNYIQGAYQMVPVGITVEGANILTRTLITFAQGALRSHPYLFAEIEALQDQDRERGLDKFARTFDDHVSFTVSNGTEPIEKEIRVVIESETENVRAETPLMLRIVEDHKLKK